jgi:predicted TIM-barrel fold metal-dependent hydrolase
MKSIRTAAVWILLASPISVPTRGAAFAPTADHHKHLLTADAAALQGPTFPTFTADQLIAELDSAGIRRAVVASVAYWFGQPGRTPPVVDEYARVRAENDWVGAQVARYPDRLVGLCSFNPISDYASAELERCAGNPHLKGLKFHVGNSRINLLDSSHVEKVRLVFRAANARRLPILIHLWTSLGGNYGREDALTFLNRILPEAPDVVVQIAHFAGGGPGYTDSALEVYADAISARDPRVKNVYFDVTTVADQQTEATLRQFAARVRQVGIERVLWGSDLSLPNGNPTARDAWANFRAKVPLTDAEFRTIASNLAPYLR